METTEAEGKYADPKARSYKPAKGNPTQGIETGKTSPGTETSPARTEPVSKVDFVLVGDSAKEKNKFRSVMRSSLKKAGISRKNVNFKSNVTPALPLCNRVSTGWHMPEAPCRCAEWPQWIAIYGNTMLCKPVTWEVVDSEQKSQIVEVGQKVMYWRPGKGGKKWWYNGIVSELWEVTFPSGQSKIVVGLN